MLKDLFYYCEEDFEKKRMINEILYPSFQNKGLFLNELSDDFCSIPLANKCPEDLNEYYSDKNSCFDSPVSLKNISDKIKIKDIQSCPEFIFEGQNEYKDFEEIFTDSNRSKLNDFRFTLKEYVRIADYIKKSALHNMVNIAEDNDVNMNTISLLDKVLLFAKSFVEVEYKSFGSELGFFKFKTVTVDDRQTDSLQITTLIHELSHFLLKEILTGILCKIFDCTNNSLIEALSIFILSFSNFTQLIDEYSAHSVEGRFTVFGYQDYSSFIRLEKTSPMTKDEIDITKSIGNTFSITIKEILESFIDDDLREDIKNQFLADVRESPNYEMLEMENCSKLTDEGFMKAIRLILTEGFEAAMLNIDKLKEYEEMLQ